MRWFTPPSRMDGPYIRRINDAWSIHRLERERGHRAGGRAGLAGGWAGEQADGRAAPTVSGAHREEGESLDRGVRSDHLGVTADVDTLVRAQRSRPARPAAGGRGVVEPQDGVAVVRVTELHVDGSNAIVVLLDAGHLRSVDVHPGVQVLVVTAGVRSEEH